MVATHLMATEVVQLIRLADKAGRKRSPENNALVAYVERLIRDRVQQAIQQGYIVGGNDAVHLAKFGIDVTDHG